MTIKNFIPTNVPEFNIPAQALRVVFDQAADYAAQGVEKIESARLEAPIEMQPLLTELLALFRAIGFETDETALDTGAELKTVWGIQ